MHSLRAHWRVQCLLLFLAPLALIAQEDTAADRADQEKSKEKPEATVEAEIEVTATVPELTTKVLISGEDLLKLPQQDLVESTRYQPGMSAARRGNINLDPQVRGLQETEVAMLVDGTRTFAAGPGRMDSGLSHVSPHAVQSLDVVKGPYALTWGAGALSAVQIHTIRPDYKLNGPVWHGNTGLRFESNASRADAYGGVQAGAQKWRFLALVSGRQGSDYEAGDGTTIPGNYSSYEGRVGLGLRPNDRSSYELDFGYQQQDDIDYPGRQLDATYFYTRSYIGEGTWTVGDRLSEIYAQLYSNRKDHLMNNDNKPTAQPMPGRVPPFGLEVRLPTESNTTGGRLRFVGGPGSLQWLAGADAYSLHQNANRTISRRDTGMVLFEDIVWPNATIDDVGAWGQLVLDRSTWSLSGTLRLDQADATAGQVSDFFLANTTGDLDQANTNVSAALSFVSRLSDSWHLTTAIGQAVRQPSVLERYSDRFPSTKFQIAAEFLGDPGIEPETSRQIDLGIEYKRSRTQIGGSVFWRAIDDYITVFPDPTLPKRLPMSPLDVYRYVTGTDGATFVGGEGWLRARITDGFEVRGDLSYVQGDDRTYDEPVFGLPPLTGRLELYYQSSAARFWIDLSGTFVDRQDRVAEIRLELPTPGYSFYDLAGGYRFNDRWQLRLGIANLTDKAYVNHLNALDPFVRERIPEIGRSIFATVDVSF